MRRRSPTGVHNRDVWAYVGSGALVTASLIAGVYGARSAPFVWTAAPMVVVYVLAFLFIVCGIGLVRDWHFPWAKTPLVHDGSMSLLPRPGDDIVSASPVAFPNGLTGWDYALKKRGGEPFFRAESRDPRNSTPDQP